MRRYLRQSREIRGSNALAATIYSNMTAALAAVFVWRGSCCRKLF
jgi:hypothetical protein